MNSLSEKTAIAVLAFSLCCSAAAATLRPVESMDKDGNQLLDLGEQAAYRAVLEPLKGTTAGDDLLFELETQQSLAATAGVNAVAIAPFVKAQEPHLDAKGEPIEDCKEPFLSLQDNILDQPLIRCNRRPTDRNAASLSVTNDFDSGETTISVKGGVSAALPLGPAADGFNDSALALFLEADGTFREKAGEDEGYARVGVKGEVNFPVRELFSNVSLGLGAYYQSDLGLNAEGYGAQLSITPQSGQNRINGFIGNSKRAHHFFLLGGIVDGFHIDDSGRTNLTSGDDYLWLGGFVGATAFFPLEKSGLKFTTRLDAFVDTISGDDAIMGTVGTSLFLNDAGSAAIALNYTHGRSRQDLESEDKLVLSLDVLF